MLWSGKPYISVRVLGHSGQYPEFEIRQPGHVFVAHRDLVWCAVQQPALDESWELGEVSVLSPEEVRLFAALALSEADPWLKGRPTITLAAQGSLDLATIGADLTRPAALAQLRALAEKLAAEKGGDADRSKYEVRSIGSAEAAAEILESIDVTDQLVLAGLARFLGADRVMTTTVELEEASLSLFAAFGAALEYVRLALSTDSQEAPFSEVYAYVERTFPMGAEVVAHLRELYDLRVTATHPANRMGEFWAPPLMADDVYSLRDTVAALYRHILLGAID